MHKYKIIPNDKELKERFIELLRVNILKRNGCWLWCNGGNMDIYGTIMYKSKRYLAHRVSFALFRKEPLVQGLVIDHLCNNKKCVNPKHLKQTTIVKNSNRGKQNNGGILAPRNVLMMNLLFKGSCLHGHDTSSIKSVATCPSKDKRWYLQCKKCKSNYFKKRNKK